MRTMTEVMLILKTIRNKKGISVQEATSYIQAETSNRIAKKTVYGWEEGISRPDMASFMALCKMYGIRDINELFTGETMLEDVDIALRDKLYEAYVNKPEVHEAVAILLGME